MWILADFTFLALAIILHATSCRLPRSRNSVIRFLIVGSTVGVVLIAVLTLVYGLSPQLIAGVLIYAFLCELYIFLFTLAMSSISANLLLNLSYGSMTQQQIDHNYDSSLMLTKRVNRMVINGLIKDTGHEIRLTLRGRRLLQMLERLRTFFHHTELCRHSRDDY